MGRGEGTLEVRNHGKGTYVHVGVRGGGERHKYVRTIGIALRLLSFQLLYHHILNVERKPLTTKGYPLVIYCKTFQQLNLIIPRESDCLDIMDTIKQFSQPGTVWALFVVVWSPIGSVCCCT